MIVSAKEDLGIQEMVIELAKQMMVKELSD